MFFIIIIVFVVPKVFMVLMVSRKALMMSLGFLLQSHCSFRKEFFLGNFSLENSAPVQQAQGLVQLSEVC